jgi:hypothetical protein
MSTQTTFDIDGLARAVVSRNADYQLALYADHAEVEFIDPSHPEAPLQVLRGKQAIQEWLLDMCSPEVRYQVRDTEAGHQSVHFTEECAYPDGTGLRYDCRAEIKSGQITRARVAVVGPPAHDPAGETATRTERPVDPSAPTRRASGPQDPSGMVEQGIPGHFFG